MAQPEEEFRFFVKRVREAAGLSTREVANRSTGLISHGYVSQIENGQVASDGISPRRLLGLARGLGIPIDEVVAAALGLARTELAANQARLMGFFDTLPEEKQTEAIGLLKALSEMYGMKTKTIAQVKKAKARRRA
jgi:transcriptional regulator with XRE-family HTH domain